MSIREFRSKMLSGAPIAGTFLKTPAYQLVEVLAQSDLDCLCLDAEHAPFDRAALDACIAIGRALDFPILVRPGDGSPREVLQALDYGAAGIIAPHIDTVEKAEALARSARFGLHGRGYAGSTRWADYATRAMPDLLDASAETIVLAQIEEPAGVEAADAIAAVEGIDGLFLGPADLSVGYGHRDQTSDDLARAFASVGAACRAHGKHYMTFVANGAQAQSRAAQYGVTGFMVGSEHGWARAGANADAADVHAIKG
ncbi:HpcH/HpaI aldolase family protein [Primorskyibacter sp. S187A]|uniref:HpcH/HpaI aldolase family protein n=1 Tax=Primorskyibacter sp. S187A TaxID=3415130 RepID=UPI003C7AD7FC